MDCLKLTSLYRILFPQVHRVLIPEEQIRRRQRRSLAFFFDPDVDAVITCMDGSNKYPPVTSGEWVKMKQNLAHK